jgi:phage shock protein C
MNKLYKNKDGGKLLGVCQGVSEFFTVDPTIVRLIFVLGAFCGGSAILLYLIMALVLDEKPVV